MHFNQTTPSMAGEATVPTSSMRTLAMGWQRQGWAPQHMSAVLDPLLLKAVLWLRSHQAMQVPQALCSPSLLSVSPHTAGLLGWGGPCLILQQQW